MDYEALMIPVPSGHETFQAKTLVEKARKAREKRVARGGEPDRAGISDKGRETLLAYAKAGNISARSHKNILRVARTIADIEGSENVEAPHILEALQYRKRE